MSQNLLNMLNHLVNHEILDRSFHEEKPVIKHTSASFIESLQKITITEDNTELSCAICQDSFKLGENVIKLPCSGNQTHYYHYDTDAEICEGILPWLKNNNTCPVCRTEFPFDEPEDNTENTGNNNEENANEENNPMQDVDDIMRSIFNRSNYINMIARPRPMNASGVSRPNVSIVNPMNYPVVIGSDFNIMAGPLNASLSARSNINQMMMGNNIGNRFLYFSPMMPSTPIYSEDNDPELQEAIMRSLED
jgi:hypothetical protein